LNNGKKMPLVGHCLWKIPNEKIADHVYNAIKAGYHLFDGACGEPTITFKEASLT
jgi:D-xylose reductase